MSCAFEKLDAAYVLGSLAPAERAEYERHLQACDACATAVRELAGMPGLLARVPADVLEEPVRPNPVPETLLPGLVAAAQKQQRRRTVRTALLAAAAVAVIAGGSAVVGTNLGDDETPPSTSPQPTVQTPATTATDPTTEPTAQPQRMEAVGRDNRSEGWVTLTPTTVGVRVALTCTYRSDYGGEHDYNLVAYATNGDQESKTFEATTGVEKNFSDDFGIALEDIEKVTVENSYGDVVLLLNLS